MSGCTCTFKVFYKRVQRNFNLFGIVAIVPVERSVSSFIEF